jgi:hypothetical protein
MIMSCPLFVRAVPGFCLRENCRYFTPGEKCGYVLKIREAERELQVHKVKRLALKAAK